MRFVRIGGPGVVGEVRHDEMEGVAALGFEPEGRMVTGGGSTVKVWQEAVWLDDDYVDSDERETDESDDEEDDEESNRPVKNGVAKPRGQKRGADRPNGTTKHQGGNDEEEDGDDDDDDDQGSSRRRRKRKRNGGKDRTGGTHFEKIPGFS